MEVHHHPHVGHNKKFKEYFLEFLMIFLAVTLGFFAESLREHMSENKKEKEFVRGIIADLKADTSKLQTVVEYYDKVIPLIDSGRKNFDQLKHSGGLRALTQLQYSLAGFQDFIYTDATLQQLRSSGGLMLLSKKGVVDSILMYDSRVKSALINEKVLGDLMINMQHAMSKILNLRPLLEIAGRENDPVKRKFLADSINRNMPDLLMLHDEPSLGRFYNDYTYYQQIAGLVRLQMASLKVTATQTIAAIKKMYGAVAEEKE